MPTKIKLYDDIEEIETNAGPEYNADVENMIDSLHQLQNDITEHFESRIINPNWTVTLDPNEEITLLSDIESSSRISTLVGTGLFSEDFSADLIDKNSMKKETKKLRKEEKIRKKLKKDIKELEENIKDSISDLEV